MSAPTTLFGPHLRFVTLGVAVGFMTLEYGVARLARLEAHDLRETAATLGVAVGERLIRALEAAALAIPFGFVYAHRLASIDPRTGLGLAGLFLGAEFLYYWHHRASHRVRWLWATHSVHHSPTRLNFTAAIRLGWTGNISGNFLFFLPLVWLGYPPLAVVAMLQVNLLYQFFLHTEFGPRLGPLEWVLNAPAHHRVHHASNAQCLDRNYGGILILFDRLFGSFAAAPATEPLRYGLVDARQSYNPVGVALGGWVQLLEDAAHAPGIAAKLATLFGPPSGSHAKSETPRMKLAALVLLVTFLAAAPAQAQTAPDQNGKGGALRTACKADYQRLCKGTQPGGGRILQCLKSHDADLSPDCKTTLSQAPAKN